MRLIKPFKLGTGFGQSALAVAQVGATIAAAIGLCIAAAQIYDSHKVESARFALQFDDRLNKPQANAILDAVGNIPQDKILKEHGGAASDDDLEELLGNYDTLYYLYKDGLISDQLLYDIFCSSMQDLHSDAEAKTYLASMRVTAGGRDVYVGFDKLTAICDAWDRNGKGHRLAR